MDSSEINDVRVKKNFSGKSFSGYKLSDVKQILLTELLRENINDAFYWTSELLCCGQILAIWDILTSFVTNYVGISNPKLCVYLEIKKKEFDKILRSGYTHNTLLLRNNQNIQKMLCEIVIVICKSPKCNAFEQMKTFIADDFMFNNMKDRLKAPNDTLAKPFLLEDDPVELFIALNEFVYELQQKKTSFWNTMYWLEWILQYERFCKNNGTTLVASSRNVPVVNMYKKDVIWIIWDIILAHSASYDILKRITNSLFSLFCMDFKSAHKQKRKSILFLAIQLIVQKTIVDFDTPIILKKESIENAPIIVNHVFSKIKEHEIAPNTGYLFDGICERSQLEQTHDKLTKLNTINM